MNPEGFSILEIQGPWLKTRPADCESHGGGTVEA